MGSEAGSHTAGVSPRWKRSQTCARLHVQDSPTDGLALPRSHGSTVETSWTWVGGQLFMVGSLLVPAQFSQETAAAAAAAGRITSFTCLCVTSVHVLKLPCVLNLEDHLDLIRLV